MSKKIEAMYEILFPSKKTNLFVLSIFLLGVFSGAVFLIFLSAGDKELITNEIMGFFQGVYDNNLDFGQAFRNSLGSNLVYLFLLFLLGFSVIGVLFNIFLIYLKGFFVSFMIASYILVYRVKGILVSLISVIFYQLFSSIFVMWMGIYSIMLSWYFLRHIFQKKKVLNTSSSGSKMIKKYFLIFMFCLTIAVICSVCEAFLFPRVLKLIIKFYIS